MHTFAELARALCARRAFMITQCDLDRTDQGSIAVRIREDRFPLATNGGERKTIERDRLAYRWAAGGGVVILDFLDQSVALVRYRDAGAPSFGDHWTLGSGLSSSFEDMLDPLQLAVREAVEEFLIATPDGVLIPVFEDHALNPTAFGAVGSGRHLRLQAGLTGLLASEEYIEAATTFQTLPGEEDLQIYLDDETNGEIFRGLICVDEGTRGIDFLRAVRIAVPYRLSDVEIFDGEDAGGKPLNAPVSCLRVEAGRIIPEFVATFQGGKRIETAVWNGKATPPLKAVMAAMA